MLQYESERDVAKFADDEQVVFIELRGLFPVFTDFVTSSDVDAVPIALV